jgi:hypothetical protein
MGSSFPGSLAVAAPGYRFLSGPPEVAAKENAAQTHADARPL